MSGSKYQARGGGRVGGDKVGMEFAVTYKMVRKRVG